MKKSIIIKAGIGVIIFILSSTGRIDAQNKMPEVMEEGTLQEQTEYMKDRMNIYNGYRAVRDDIFLKMLQNSMDSLNASKSEINTLNTEIDHLLTEKTELSDNLEKTNEELREAIRNRDSMSLFGIPMNKVLYNSILWTIIAGLIFVLFISLAFVNRSRKVLQSTKKDHKALKDEFDAYKKTARETREEMVIKHFNEIQKLKEGR